MKDNKKFGEFIEEVSGKIKEYLPESFENCEIEVKSVVKNNGLTLTGISCKKENSHIAAVVYLNELFERYESGVPIDDIVKTVAQRCSESDDAKSVFDVSIIESFESAKNRIIPKLINTEWNEEYLKGVVHAEFLDLSVIYRVLINESENGAATTTITNQMMEKWGVKFNDIHKAAFDNVSELCPPDFKSMREVLSGITGQPLPDDIVPDNIMWVLTNSRKVDGAVCMMDRAILKFIAEKIGNFYILPSSVHEVIIVKEEGLDKDMLKDMVKTVNQEQVSVDERLSDCVYRYDPENGLDIAT